MAETVLINAMRFTAFDYKNKMIHHKIKRELILNEECLK